MTSHEYHRLMGYYHASINRPRTNVVTRRKAKSMANGTGIAIKTSRIQAQVPLEMVIRNETVKQRLIAERP